MVWHQGLTQQAALTAAIHRYVRPAVAVQMRRWYQHACSIPDPHLRSQALASMRRKRFHCEGGAVYAVTPRGISHGLIRAICSLQTLVDYLDNLADRTGTQTSENLMQLHLAVDDALQPRARPRAYYRNHLQREDGGYLPALVTECQAQLQHLEGYHGDLAETVQLFGAAYARLQVCKHLPFPERESALRAWLGPLSRYYPHLYWWELAAACGSTLGIFALWRAALTRKGQSQATVLTRSYFPWIGGLHILLDYLIDQDEDRRGGDLNFVTYYRNQGQAVQRLGLFHQSARKEAAALPDPHLHRLVVDGLLGIYLSDPKARCQPLLGATARLLRHAGPAGIASYLYYLIQSPGR